MWRQQAILFDLDGTLVDSAPGLAAATNHMLELRGMMALEHGVLRPYGGSGARGMLEAAFGVLPGETRYEAMRDEFYDHYHACMLQGIGLFAGVAGLLAALDADRVPWGVVTNKARRFAEPTLRAFGLLDRARTLVAGDCTPFTKPHPEPLLEAARRMQVAPAACTYVGDDIRDMQAGRAAGMRTWAAAWGYLGVGVAIGRWPADRVLTKPEDALSTLRLP